MQSDVRVALVGVGGYGNTYLRALLDEGAAHGARLVAAIDPRPPAEAAEELRAAGVPIGGDLAAWFADGGAADLVIVAAPIHLHAPLSCLALEHGAHVLCEKPLAGSLEDARRIIRAAEAAGRFAAIGYQWSTSDAIQALKADLVSGGLGRVRRMRTVCIWPRSRSYYDRSPWAGRLRLDDGSVVLDSPANNATAHYLHNMLYLAGPTRERSAMPREVTAELYRGKPIETYDTAAIRAVTAGGAEVLFYTTHAGRPLSGPVFEIECKRAVVSYDINHDPTIRARLDDGSERTYGDPNATRPNLRWQTIDAVRTGAPVACDARAALAQTLCVTAAMDSSEIHPLPPGEVRADAVDNGDTITWMPGLSETLRACYASWKMPSEMGDLPWSVPGRPVAVEPDAGA